MDWLDLQRLIDYVIQSHAKYPREPLKAFRKWDKRTPYGVHPTWCAMTLMTETTLPEDFRWVGAQALLLHDILEDTTAPLPRGTSNQVKFLVDEMTFPRGTTQEMAEVWSRSEECRLLKLYDKVNNLMDRYPQDPAKLHAYITYTMQLTAFAETKWGQLNIVRLAYAICY